MQKNYNLSIGVMFKNEAHIVDEWVKHYLRIGADHLYMINHWSNDNYMDILSSYINEKKVTLFNSKHEMKKYGQINAYNKLITPHVKENNWFAFLDMDEFLYSRKNNSVINILNNSKYDAYSVPWINFGSNNLGNTPKSAIKSFTRRADYDSPNNVLPSLRQFKTVFNTDTFNKVVELHSVDKFSKRHEVVKSSQLYSFDENHIAKIDLAINHYSVQAQNWYHTIKSRKLAGNSAMNKYDNRYYNSMNTNQIEDYVLKQQYE